MATKPKKTYRVWAAVTVFVQGEGERAPWTKRSRGHAIEVQGNDYDQAMRAGERELARQMATRFRLVKS